MKFIVSFLMLGIAMAGGCSYNMDVPTPVLINTQEWAAYTDNFIAPEGYVIDPWNGGISHSEGQGYGLLLAAAAGDKKRFDTLWTWTQKNLQRHDSLFSWRWEKGRITDYNNAADGDILIAWGLLKGYQRWHDRKHLKHAQKIISSIQNKLLKKSAYGLLLLPGETGFTTAGTITINLSYWIFPAFQDFKRYNSNGPWDNLIKSGYNILKMSRFSSKQLPVDWIDVSENGLSVSKKFPPRFGADALRIPLHLCWDPKAPHHLLTGVRTFWNKKEQPAWYDTKNNEHANYRLSDGLLEIPTMLDQCLGIMESVRPKPNPQPSKEYYAESINLLVKVAKHDRGFTP